MSKVIGPQELIKGFIESHSDLVGHLPEHLVDKACRAEFQLMKEVMSEGDFEEVRLQYLFKIGVSPPKVMKHLRTLKEYYTAESSKERHIYYSDLLLKYIQNNLDKFKKYESRIKKYTGYTFREISGGEYIGNGYKCLAHF